MVNCFALFIAALSYGDWRGIVPLFCKHLEDLLLDAFCFQITSSTQNPLFVNFFLHMLLICFLGCMWVGSCVPWTYIWTAFCCNSYLNPVTFFYRDELQQEKQKQKHQQTNASNKITAQVRQPSIPHGVTNQQTKGCKENQFYSLLFMNSPKNITCHILPVPWPFMKCRFRCKKKN